MIFKNSQILRFFRVSEARTTKVMVFCGQNVIRGKADDIVSWTVHEVKRRFAYERVFKTVLYAGLVR